MSARFEAGMQMLGAHLMRSVLAGLALLLATAGAQGAPSAEELWRLLATPGHVAIMRHALAPGTGDPAGFKLRDCATQRNLSEAGRQQARRTGELFRKYGLTAARVLSSQWCRARETAQLLGLGPLEEATELNSTLQKEVPGSNPERLRSLIAGLPSDRPAVLVTHQVVITALVGNVPKSGELLVLRRREDGGIDVVGSIEP